MGNNPLDAGDIHEENARRRRVLADVSKLGLPLWSQDRYNEELEYFREHNEDLNEEIPEDPDYRRRGENVVHFDLDPNNGRNSVPSGCL